MKAFKIAFGNKIINKSIVQFSKKLVRSILSLIDLVNFFLKSFEYFFSDFTLMLVSPKWGKIFSL